MNGKKLILILAAVASVSGCSTVQPLDSVARRAEDPSTFESDVTVDSSSREHLKEMKKLAWVAYSVDFECPKTCAFTVDERKRLATEIAETSFAAVDREIRRALGSDTREILATDATTRSVAFRKEIRTNSFKSAVSRWFDRLGLSRAQEVVVPAQGLKSLNPSELGWNGGRDVADLGRDLGVDGMMVGYVHVAPEGGKSGESRLTISGPRFWLFSTKTATAIASAGLRTNWRLESTAERSTDEKTLSAPVKKLDAAQELQATRLNWTGFDQVASGFSQRIATVLAK